MPFALLLITLAISWPIFTILSLLDSALTLQQNRYRISQSHYHRNELKIVDCMESAYYATKTYTCLVVPFRRILTQNSVVILCASVAARCRVDT